MLLICSASNSSAIQDINTIVTVLHTVSTFCDSSESRGSDTNSNNKENYSKKVLREKRHCL